METDRKANSHLRQLATYPYLVASCSRNPCRRNSMDDAQKMLHDLWLTARKGTMNAREQAKAWALREVWIEQHVTRTVDPAQDDTRGSLWQGQARSSARARCWQRQNTSFSTELNGLLRQSQSRRR